MEKRETQGVWENHLGCFVSYSNFMGLQYDWRNIHTSYSILVKIVNSKGNQFRYVHKIISRLKENLTIHNNLFMKVTLLHTDTVILSTIICKKDHDLTLTIASFVWGISEIIPSVIISSTKYLEVRMNRQLNLGITKPRNSGTPKHRNSYFFQLFFLEHQNTLS